MPQLNITGSLTVDEIRQIRDYDYEMTKNMTREERRAYYHVGVDETLAEIEQLRRRREEINPTSLPSSPHTPRTARQTRAAAQA